MSRSYKHYPFAKDRDSCKWGKRHCNKKVRNTKDIPNGCAYKKLVEPWDYIYDYCHTEFKKDVIKGWESTRKSKAQGVDGWYNWYDADTLEEELIQWKKWYLSK